MEPIVFNHFDYLVIGLIILSGFIAFFRGFIQESLSLLLWVIAFATSMFLDVYLDPYFLDYIQSPEIRRILIIILVFVGIIFLGGFLIKVIRSLVHWSGMSGLDRLLGVLFGLLRGVNRDDTSRSKRAWGASFFDDWCGRKAGGKTACSRSRACC